MQFVPLQKQRMLFADTRGFGILNAGGIASRLQDLGSSISAPTTLRISNDARTVQITDDTSGHVLRFELARRTVATDPPEEKALAAAITGSTRIKLTDWEANTAPN